MTETTSIEIVQIDHEIIKKLFGLSIKKDWKEVVKMYKNDPRVHKAKFTRSGNTALHMAFFDDEGGVEELVRIILNKNEADNPEQHERKKSKAKEVLEIKNERGNTPLHLAALIGSETVCELIAEVDRSLVVARNDDNETPFFLAALYGKKKAFFYLDKYTPTDTKERYDYCRRKDGDTILHCAIDGDYFELAFQIIHLYPDLVHSDNELGFSPLHRLASNSYAFRSGIDLGICSKILYHCIPVDKLKPPSEKQSTVETTPNNKKSTKCLENYRTCIKYYRTCIKFFELFWKMVQVDCSSLRFTTKKEEKNEETQADAENPQGFQDTNGAQELRRCSWCLAFGFVMLRLIMLPSIPVRFILRRGFEWIRRIRDLKETHVWSDQIMNELLKITYDEHIGDQKQNPSTQSQSVETNQEDKKKEKNGKDKDLEGDQTQTPTTQSVETNQEDKNKEKNGKDNGVEGHKGKFRNRKKETPILIAAKNGVIEMVEKILEYFPEAIHDMNTDKKNIMLLAVENRQPYVYQFLVDRIILEDDTFQKVDNEGNSAIHLAVKLGDKSWLNIPGPALQMQWEIKWLEFVLSATDDRFVPLLPLNNEGKTPWDIFEETHKDLLEKGGKWLNDMSQSCSVVAGLLVTVAYNTSTTVPGGVKGDQGTPILEHYTAFGHFAVWSLVAFYSSLSAVVMFLSILTSGYQLKDFRRAVFIKLLLGLTAFYVSIASTLASFTAGHYFILKDKLKKWAAPVYTVTCLLVILFAIAQFPIYIKVLWATFKKVPDRSYKEKLQYYG